MKVFKPFWSFNIKNIENWLSENAQKGYMLKAIDTRYSTFIFEQSEKKSSNFRIFHTVKGITDIQDSLKRDGWYTVFCRKRWFIIANDKPPEDIKANPSRENLYTHIVILLAITSVIAIYYAILEFLFIISLLLFLVIPYLLEDKNIVFINDFSTKTLPKDVSQFGIIDFVGCAEILAVTFIAFILVKKLSKNFNQLKKEHKANLDNQDEESLKDDTVMKKKSLWFLEPDKLENWLEDLEEKGFNLRCTNRKGNEFFFTEGNPRKIRYAADFVSMDKEAYYDLFKEDGWNLNYSSQSEIIKWNLWSKEYTDERPEIYTTKDDKIAHGKKVLTTYTVIFILINIIWYIFNSHNISFNINNLWESLPILLFNMIPFVVFVYFYSKIIRFYCRIKKTKEN